MMSPPMRGREEALQKLREPKPKNIREVPGYLGRIISNFFRRLFYIFELVWEAKPWILLVMLLYCLISGVLPVVGAFINAGILNTLAQAYTSALTGGPLPFQGIIGLLILKFIYLFASALIGNIYQIIIRISGELVSNHIKVKIIEKARDVDLASFDMPQFYEKMENASREAGNRPVAILQSTFNILSVCISVISYIAILAAISPWAPAIIVALSVPTAVISFIYRKKNFQYMRHRSKDRRQMNYYNNLMVDKDVAKEVRIFHLSDIFIDSYKKTFQQYFVGMKKLIVQEGIWSSAMAFIAAAVNCSLFLYIANLVRLGTAQIGDYSLYTGALESISAGVSSLITTTATIYEGTLFIDNMISFMEEQPKILPILSQPLHVKRYTGHTIEFRHVSFAYPGTTRRVIDDVSFIINPGETLVLVGLNGAGKTTLIKLLTRLYDPTEGVILLDGEDIRSYDINELYDMFGIIFQDFGKYAFTAGENIQFGQASKGYVPKDIAAAATAAGADAFIGKLKNGLDTPLTRYFEPDGTELSIGQWQKLSVARAFYSDSDVLILDEPTASLDPLAEQEIFNQFEHLRQDKTTIFVSHRLSSATIASKILVLEQGKIVESGNHAQLMMQRGKYWKLFSTQAERYTGEKKDRKFPPDSPPKEMHPR